jgi:hypothetical protein
MPAPVWTPEKESAFFAALAETASVSHASTAVKISRQTAYTRREQEPEFAQRWEEALQLGVEALEDEATRRGFHGVDRPVFHQGEVCGTIREYSDTLAIFLLKAHKPEKYRERFDVEHAGRGGGPMQTVSAQMTPEQAAQAYKELMGG